MKPTLQKRGVTARLQHGYRRALFGGLFCVWVTLGILSRAFSAVIPVAALTQGFALGWDEAAPSALNEDRWHPTKLSLAGLGALPFAVGFGFAEVTGLGYALEGVFFA